MQKRKIAVFGSTGSVGRQTLEVIKNHSDKFEIEALICNQNLELLNDQIKEFNPKFAAIADGHLKDCGGLNNSKTKFYFREEGILEIIRSIESDLIVMAISGSKALKPTLEAIKMGKNIALASKEVMVMAGEIVMEEINKQSAGKLMPVDSEHNAIWQCLSGGQKDEVEKIILTCSGGPFRNYSSEELKEVGVKEALKHPNWSMGKKITVDCASLMNKGLEVIEAKWLFGVDVSQIEVVVHPESAIHSAVQFKDGSIIAQIGPKTMELAIQYALSFPKRLKAGYEKLDLINLGKMNFFKPDTGKFPCLKYALEAIKLGGTMPTVLNAANEIAVEQFLNEQIKFLDIPEIIKGTMETHKVITKPNITNIFEADSWAREKARMVISSLATK